MELDTRNDARRPVKELTRQTFSRRIQASFFPPRYQIVTLIYNHATHGGNLIGRILQVGIHSEYHLTLRLDKPAIQSGRFTVVTGKFYSFDIGIFGFKPFDN